MLLEVRKIKTGYKVADAMTEKPVTISPEESLRTCAEEMRKRHVGTVIVGDEEKIVGVLTEQDIVRKTIAEGVNPLEKNIKDIMETDLVMISPDKDIYDALIKMRDLNIRHLPVIDDGKLIGLLTLKDILKIEPQLFDLMVEKFELREEERKPIHRIIDGEGVCQTCGEYAEKLENTSGALVCGKCKVENGS